MKISAVYQNIYLQPKNVERKKDNTSFGSIANAGKLKTLFSYGLPCMYSGVEMIDPKRAQKLLKNGVFKKTSLEEYINTKKKSGVDHLRHHR